jgi:uncharacterized protein YerC
MAKKYIVRLSKKERTELENLISCSCTQAQKLRRAQILLHADANGPNCTDAQIKEVVGVSQSTVKRVRKAFTFGLDMALNRRNPSRKRSNDTFSRKLDSTREARLLALAYSPAPKGHQRWTLRLLAEKMVELEHVDSLSYETVRRVLKKNEVAPWSQEQWITYAQRNA